jgi:inorganic pyrophosphatase
MTSSLDQIATYDDDDLTVVVDTPKDSQNKFAYEPRFGAFVLEGVLPAGAVFPFDFGFVPSTRGDDGDPIDILVLKDAPAFLGCIVPSRLIGAIQAEQTEKGKTERNDRLLAVAANSITHKSIRSLSDVSADLIGQIEHFFVSYNKAKGKKFVPKRRVGPDAARTLVERARQRAKRRYSGWVIPIAYFRTELELHDEGTLLARYRRCSRRYRSGPHDPEPARCGDQDHVDRHLRIGPAPV